METTTTLESYINTRNFPFNRFALKLYLENLEHKAFEQSETPLIIFKFIADKMIEHCGKFFPFVDEFNAYIDKQQLSLPQQQLLYRIVKEYLKVKGTKSFSNTDYEYYYEDYLSYFRTLSQVIDHNTTEATLATTSVPSLLNDIIHRQVLTLSEGLDKLPVEKKAVVVTSLVKSLSIGSKIKNAQTNNIIQLTPSPLERVG